MAGDLRQMVVSLSLDTSNFSKNIKMINSEIQLVQAQFVEAGAGITNFEGTLDGASAKLKMLSQVQDAQARAITNYNAKITETAAAYDRHTATLDKYTAKLPLLEENYVNLGKAVEAASAEYKAYDAVVQEASKKYNDSIEEVKRLEAEMAKLDTSTAEGKAAYDQYNAQLEIAKQKQQETGDTLKGLLPKWKELQTNLMQTAQAHNEAGAAVDKTKGQIEAEKRTIEEDITKLNKYQSAWANLSTAQKETAQRLYESRQAVALMSNGWAEAEAAIKSSESSLTNYSSQLSLIQAMFTDAGNAVGGFSSKGTLLAQSVALQQQKVEALKNEIAAWEEKIRAAQGVLEPDKIAEMNNQLNTAKVKLIDASNALNQAKQQQILFANGWTVAQDAIDKQNASLTIYSAALTTVSAAYDASVAGLSGFAAGLASIPAKVEMLTDSLRILDQEYIALDKEANAYALQIQAAMAAGDQGKVDELTAKLLQLQGQMYKNRAEAANYQAELNSMTGVFGTVATYLKNLGQSFTDLGMKFTTLSSQLGRVTNYIKDFGEEAIEASNDFESAMAYVHQTVKESTETTYEDLSNFVKELSQQVGITATDLLDLVAASGQLGVETDDLMGFVKTVADIAATTNISLEDAGTEIAQYANITGMQLDEASGDLTAFGSTLVELANNTATTGDEILSMATNIASTGALLDMSDSEILALSATLSSLGLKSEKAGSAISKSLQEIEVAVSTGSDEIADFARISGMSADQFVEAWRDDPTQTFMAFIQGLANLDDEETNAIAVLTELGWNNIRVRDTTLRLVNGQEKLQKNIELASQAWSENTALVENADKMYETTATKIQNVKDAWNVFAITVGDDLKPALNSVLDMIQGVIQGFQNMDSGTRAVIERIGLFAVGVTSALSVLGILNTFLGAGLKALGSLASGIGNVVNVLGSLGMWLSTKGLLGPVGGIALAVAGFVALSAAVDAATLSLDELDDHVVETNKTRIEELNENIETHVNVEEPEIDYAGEGETLMEDIFAWLTDGKADTSEQKKEFQEQVDSYVSEVVGEIDLSENEELAQLQRLLDDGIITSEEFETAAAGIKDKYAELRGEAQDLRDDMNDLIDDYAGKSTSTVQDAYAEFQAIEKQVDELIKKLGLADEAYNEYAENAMYRVEHGAGTTEDVSVSLQYVSSNLEVDKAAIDKDVQDYKDRVTEEVRYAIDNNLGRKEGETDEDFEARMHADMDEKIRTYTENAEVEKNALEVWYAQQIDSLMSGLSTIYPEEMTKLQEWYQNNSVINALQDATQTIADTTDFSGFDTSTIESIRKSIEDTLGPQVLSALDLAGYDLSQLQGLEGSDLSNSLSYMLQAALNNYLGSGEIEGEITDMFGEDSEFAAIIGQAIENGWFSGFNGLDLSFEDGSVASFFSGNFAEEFVDSICGDDETLKAQVMAALKEKFGDYNMGELATGSVDLSDTGDSEGVPVNINLGEVTVKDKEAAKQKIADAVNTVTSEGEEGLSSEDNSITVDGEINIGEMKVTGQEGLEGELNEIGEYIPAGLENAVNGYNFGFGVMAGSVVGALMSSLDEHSPSKLTEPVGEYAAAGVENGANGYKFDLTHVGTSMLSSLRVAAKSTKFESIGKNAMSGVRRGVENGESAAVNAAAKVAENMLRAMKSKLEIKSPSRVFRDQVGVMISRGVGVGVEEEAKRQKKAIANAVKYMTGAAGEGMLGNGFSANDNRKTYNSDSSVTINGTFNVRQESDIDAIATRIANLTKQNQRGRGVRTA